MAGKVVKEIWPEEFESYIDSHNESDYLLVDVRQPEEYADEHIPGAKLIPLGKIDDKIGELPVDKDIIFYCAAGSRSRIAALMAAEQINSKASLFSLSGGIMAWESRLVHDLPKIELFESSGSVSDMLNKALELEKGAYLFYSSLLEKYEGHSFISDLESLAKAETAHARLVHSHMKNIDGYDADFETIFSGLKGDIIEGGLSFKDLMKTFDAFTERDLCIHVMETALDIEYAAYDLYRVMSDKVTDKSSSDVFISLAQAEKAHMRIITKAIGKCTSKDGI